MIDLSDIDGVDLLSLWRTVPIDDMTKALVGRLVGALIARARADEQSPQHEALLLRAQGRDIEAWLLLGDFFQRLHSADLRRGPGGHRQLTDATASCLLVATTLGSRWSAALLVLRLSQIDFADDDRGTLETLAGALSVRFTLSSPMPKSVLESLQVFGEVAATIRPPVPAPDVKPDPKLMETEGPTVIVLCELPKQVGDRDLKAIVEHYQPLASPIGLAGLADPDGLATTLDGEFPWAKNVVEEIRAELILSRRMGRKAFHLPTLLLVGAPGVGKSVFIRRLGILSGVPSAMIVAGGSTDNRLLAGTARGWASASPNFPLATIRRHCIANPIVAVEEIDKAGGSERSGYLTDKLCSMIDRSLSLAYLDECLLVAADLSHVNWVLTANRLDRVPPAIRAKCRTLHFPPPRPEDFQVLRSGIMRDIAGRFGVEVATLPELPAESIDRMRAGFERGRLQARQLSNLIGRALALQAAADHIPTQH